MLKIGIKKSSIVAPKPPEKDKKIKRKILDERSSTNRLKSADYSDEEYNDGFIDYDEYEKKSRYNYDDDDEYEEFDGLEYDEDEGFAEDEDYDFY